MTDLQTVTTLDYPIACRLEGAGQAARLREVADLFSAVTAVDATDSGYAFQFPGTDDVLSRLTMFVVEERRCCPFLAFDLYVPPGGETVSLHLSGGEGIKEFIAATFVPDGGQLLSS